ncbi:MAG: MaoC family dehydratase [Nitrososphaerales archaeon]
MNTSHESGPYFEDFVIGEKIAHEDGRTITDTDNIWFSLLTCNSNQVHFNKDYAEKNFANQPFNGRLLVNSALVFSIVLGLSAKDTSKNGFMLGMTDWQVKNPTFAGDTIYAESEIVSKRESESHKTMGLVSVSTRGFNQRNVTVLTFKRTFMVPKSGKTWE